MLTRAFTKPKKHFKDYSEHSRSVSFSEYDDCIVGLMDDLPLISCGNHGPKLSLKEVLRTSVSVMGENNRGFTEKVVLSNVGLRVLKRFRKVTVGKSEFVRRVERLAQVCKECEYLVPITAYLYAKRIKLVVCDYYPMGSLADLLSGGRQGQTALNWHERLMIIDCIARAISFIHAQSPSSEKNAMKMNVHGNIKSSNVMINIDLTVRLSDFGFVQLADSVEDSDNKQARSSCSETLSQKSDIFNFGLVVLDILAGVKEPGSGYRIKCILDTKESIEQGKSIFFEFHARGKERKQALKVLDIALACTNRSPQARPSIEQILLNLSDIHNSVK